MSRIATTRAIGWAALVAGLFVARAGAAQCGGNRSSCSTCHDGARAALPSRKDWHEDHAFADICPTCHGGRGDLDDLAAAHAGLVDPLEDAEQRCGACHGANAKPFVERYRIASFDDAGVATDIGGATPLDPSKRLAPPSPPPVRRPHGEPGPNLALTAIVALVGAFGMLSVVQRERERGRRDRAAQSPRDSLSSVRTAAPEPRSPLRDPWSPYVAGFGLGLVVAVSMAVFGHRLSGAGAYQHLSGFVGRPLSPDSVYWNHVVPTGVTWDVLVLIGSVLGAFVAAKLAGQFALRVMPDRQWVSAFGPSRGRRWLVAFVGSLLTEVGGGLAGGCTASLAVSGGAVLAPAAFVFMAGMFAGGVPTALLIYRKVES